MGGGSSAASPPWGALGWVARRGGRVAGHCPGSSLQQGTGLCLLPGSWLCGCLGGEGAWRHLDVLIGRG